VLNVSANWGFSKVGCQICFFNFKPYPSIIISFVEVYSMRCKPWLKPRHLKKKILKKCLTDRKCRLGANWQDLKFLKKCWKMKCPQIFYYVLIKSCALKPYSPIITHVLEICRFSLFYPFSKIAPVIGFLSIVPCVNNFAPLYPFIPPDPLPTLVIQLYYPFSQLVVNPFSESLWQSGL